VHVGTLRWKADVQRTATNNELISLRYRAPSAVLKKTGALLVAVAQHRCKSDHTFQWKLPNFEGDENWGKGIGDGVVPHVSERGCAPKCAPKCRELCVLLVLMQRLIE